MYSIEISNKFKKDYKLCIKRGLDITILESLIETLEETGAVPAIFKPHPLVGNYVGFWECHIKPDWLLIWAVDEQEKVIYLARTGSHSDLF